MSTNSADADQTTISTSAEAGQPQLTKAQIKKQKEAERIKRIAKTAGISKKDVKAYNITNSQAKEIKQASNWASGGKVESVRQCESGGNYGINTGNGYYGAYQFDAGTWRSVGGGEYAPYANQAPAWAQDYMAWTLYNSRGWSPWTCA